ncbi:MAG: DUF6279 family lipoprotein [Polaromonas sp.]|uniref:DUF6279 family lipoprotein n=1 Tax=Polaromonas sp. TaxID=1869339 RepID=UPI00272FF3A6|nr:DUF6279 family lipoprotein [Polaromonas sp.]MDP2449290.1 DUF6279 family lipoprotein [Polaromonas sp.]MDP3245515.1 DUF6279 family lipoprotein [Polaromonas sp.]MDP3754693.1 DUF6279 family lipoprotein [Polaromonas sp.]
MKFPVNWGSRKWRPARPELKRSTRIIGVLLLSGTLLACSAVKFAYNQATELAYWQLNSYFEFDDTQKPLIREELASLHQWHRQTQLPAYVETLEKWTAWLPAEIDEARACGIFQEVKTRLQAISDRAVPAMGTVASTLGPEQLEALKRKFSRLNTEYRDDFLEGGPEDLIKRRLKKAVSRAEILYGTLDDRQLAVLRSRISQSVFDARLSLAEYQRRQRDALQSLGPLIAGRATSEQARPLMQAYFDRAVNSPDPAYRSYQERLTRDSCKTFAALHNSTTAAQRARAVQTLQGYAQDFGILVAGR